VSTRFRLAALALVAGQLCLAAHLGFRAEHLAGDALLLGLAFAGGRATELCRLVLPIWLAGVLYDAHPLLFGLRGEVHVGDIHAAERTLFPAPGGLTWAEYFWAHHHPVADLLAGATYLLYIPQLLLVAALLFLADRRRLVVLGWGFFALNAAGLAVYLAFPAAPPWYVIEHGLGPVDLSAAGSAAGAARFDQLLGISYFEHFYGRNPNVFAAMPSLHVAYPVLAAVAVWPLGVRWRLATSAFAAAMAASAIYLSHHYLLDVAAGAALAIAVGVATSMALARRPVRARDQLVTATGSSARARRLRVVRHAGRSVASSRFRVRASRRLKATVPSRRARAAPTQ
jgi:membrane-associated phospholipid phosphatase